MLDPGFKAVSFDVGNTLLYADPSASEIYAEALGRHGRRVGAEEVAPVFSEAWAEMQRRSIPGLDRYSSMGGDDRQWWGAFLREVLERLNHDAPWEPLLDDLYEAFSRAEVWKLYPDVEPTLDALAARGVAMVLISNWDRRLPDIIRQLGIEGYFRVITVSAVVGFEKPAQEIFTRTAERLGRAPAEILHVGDAPREDYQGAVEAGFGSVLIDRKGLFAGDGLRCIVSLEELLEMVAKPERTS